MNLLETILNAQNGEVVRQMAGKLRLDEGQARSAIGALVPALGRGIGRNAGRPQGLDALVGALSHGNHADHLDQPERLAGGRRWPKATASSAMSSAARTSAARSHHRPRKVPESTAVY